MKRKLFFAFLLIVAVTAAGACKNWMKGGRNKLTLTYKIDRNAAPTTKEMEAKLSFMTVSELTTTANGQAARIVMYSILLANYDGDDKTLQREMPKADGQIRVEIQLVGAEGSTAMTPLNPGTYNASQFSDGVNKYGKTLDVRVSLYENGKLMDQGISTVNPRRGFVKINSVDDENVTGEIDMTDDFRSVKGEFSAKIVK